MKRSGTHYNFNDLGDGLDDEDESSKRPFSVFRKTYKAMNYMHKFMEHFPSLTNVVLSNLPDDVFCQSSRGAPIVSNDSIHTTARRSHTTMSNGRGSRGRRMNTLLSAVLPENATGKEMTSISSKNKVLEGKATSDMIMQTERLLHTSLTDKSNLMKKLCSHCGGKGSAKKRIKGHKKWLEKQAEEEKKKAAADKIKTNDDDSSSSSSDSNEEIENSQESQASLIEQIIKREDDIAHHRMRKNKLNARMDSYDKD